MVVEMTVETAISTLSSVGEVRFEDGKIRCRIPKRRPAQVETALAVVSGHKTEAMALVATQLDLGKWALHYLNRIAGARIVRPPSGDGLAIAVWPERRGQELDLALKTLQLDHMPLLDREC